MPRYKLATHILVILSVLSFVPVHAAPVAVQEVREVCADVVNRGEDVILVNGKRAEEGQDPLTQASPGQVSTSVQLSTQGPSPTSDYASGIHHEKINPSQLPSSMSGEIQRPPYASGGTELPWYSSDGSLVTPGRGGVRQGTKSKLPSQPGTSMRTKTYSFAPGHWLPNTKIGTATPSESSGEIAPASSSRPPYASGGTETSVQSSTSSPDPVSPSTSDSTNSNQLPSAPGELRKPPYASGGTELPWYSSDGSLVTSGRGGVQQVRPGTTSKLLSQPGTSMRTKTYSFAPGHWLPNTEIGTATPSESSGEIAPASSSKVLPASEQEEPPKPQSILSKLASKPKSLFRKMGRISKSLFSEMADSPNLQIH